MGEPKGLGVMVVVLATSGLVASGCGSSSKADRFADYWADGDALCAQQATCLGGDEATCLAAWPTAGETTEAIVQAGVSDDNLADCEAATRLLDQCVLGLACEELGEGTACTAQRTAFDTSCALVVAAADSYYMTHPKSIYVGSFHGSYSGAASGTLTGAIQANGKIMASISTATGPVTATGSVFFSGAVTLSATAGGTTLSLEGELAGKTHEFYGDGTWTAGADSGTWSILSD